MTTTVTVQTAAHPAQVTMRSFGSQQQDNVQVNTTSDTVTTVAPGSSQTFTVSDSQLLVGVLELPVPNATPTPTPTPTSSDGSKPRVR